MALGKPGTVTILQGIGLGLSVPLLLVFIPAYGLLGAGFALLCSSTVRAILGLVCYPLILKVRPPGLVMTREDWYFILEKFNIRRV
jgi:O-antigen/teichoic acid export membrane protein